MSGSQYEMTVGINAHMNIGNVLSGVKQIQGAFGGLKLPANLTANVYKDFDKLNKQLREFQDLQNKGNLGKSDLKNLDKLRNSIDSTYGHLVQELNQLSSKKIILDADASKIKEAEKVVNDLQQQIQNKLSKVDLKFNLGKNSSIDVGLNSFVTQLESASGRSKQFKASLDEIKQSMASGDTSNLGAQILNAVNQAQKLKGAGSDVLRVFSQLGVIKLDTKKLEDGGYRAEKFAEALKIISPELQKLNVDVGELKNKLATAFEVRNDAFNTGIRNGQKAIDDTTSALNRNRDAARQTGNAYKGFVQQSLSATEQVQQLQQSTQYFFGLRNMINLLRQGFREALNTVKELDAAMTETAVVTKFDVGDMWEKLPEYTANANALGATIQDMYKSATLYYQQGLNADQAMSIASETMKMARIGGLEAADATDMMTAALRGFNMELSSESAQRINDVYSNLAAKTASNTQELGEAMERTASIAHSAGMSFEGTSAFLAQMIETTREAPENLGTAMKTIVARFQELKKNPLEMEEVDGEEVSFNKVDTALQSIGVTLRDTNGQFRELDQVFLDIASRWDGLSQTQQRYIATTAAGSRQQSRFIAMMNNYDRTLELMDYANNSTGASSEQFGKTMESLEAKLNKLKNAWDLFRMGLASNDMVKGFVDGLTTALNVITTLIDKLSLGSSKLKSVLTIFTAFTGLKMAGRAINGLIGGLGGLIDPNATFRGGLSTGFFGQGRTKAQAQAITVPIVGALGKISQQIAQIYGLRSNVKSDSGIKSTSRQQYLDVKKQFDNLSGKEGFRMSEASNLFSKLDAKRQQSMFNNSPGTKFAMKQASLAWFGSQKQLSKEAIQEGQTYINSIYKGMEKGRIPVDKGIELIGQPQKWGKYFGTEAAMAYSVSFVKASKPAMKKSTQEAHKYAMDFLGVDANKYGVGSDDLKALFKEPNNQQLKKDYTELFKRYKANIERPRGHEQARGQVSDIGRFANDIGAVADRFSQAGYGITAFGNALSQLGGPIGLVGTGISAMGGAITTMGMSISGVTGLISLFTVGIQDAAGATVVAGSTIAAVAAPLAALAAGFLLVRAYINKIKKDGEEVTKTFDEANKAAEDNIAKLKTYQTEFATLSQGVDSNGNNVSLDESQYQRYLEIVDDIAKINPEIVQGYNAQGHAIIDNNKALDETLKKQQQIKKETLDDYTKTSSLQKLINARNINKDYKQIQSTKQSGVADGSGHGNEGRPTSIGSAVPLAGDVSSIVDKLRLTKDFDPASLKKFGIESLDDLLEGEEQAVKNFIKHRDKIQAELTNSGIELSEGLIKGFDKLNEDQEAFDEAIQPVYDNLLASVSNSPFYEEIGSEFKSAIALGLKDIASQDLDASEMQSQANLLVQEFNNLTRAGGEYATAMDEVEAAQDTFASSLDASEYAKNTENALTTLNNLLKEYEGNTTAYGQAVSEYLTNQIEKIKNFTTEGTTSVTEALNGVTNTISAAEGSYQAFQDATKTDLSTGADNMKSIFEEITKETDGVQLHMEKFGDNTMWEGARALLGDEFVEKNAGNVDKVKKEILSLKDELQDGEEGFKAFWENFQKVDDSKIEGFRWNEDGSYNIDRNLNPDAYKEIAEQMHRSEQYVVSMLNKGRQFADINFTNVEEVRKALSTDGAAIKGTSTSTFTNDQGKKETVTDIFVKEDYLKNAVREAVGSNPAEQKEAIDNITKSGVKIIPSPNDMTKKDFKNMGITDLPSLIRTLGDTGQFNRSEVEEYAQQMKGYDEGEFDTLYKDYLDSQEHPELPSINSIDGNVASIAGMLAHNLGIVSQEDRDNYHEANKLTYGEEGVMDSLPQLFSLGQNSKGEALSADEFDSIQKELTKQSQSYENAAKSYDALAKKATEEGNVKDAAWFTEAAKDYRKMSGDISDYIEAGIKAYNDNLEAEKRKGDTRTNAEKAEDSKSTADKEQEKRNKKEEAKAESQRKFNEEQHNKYDSSNGPSGKSLDEQRADQEAKKAAKAKHTAELQAQQAEQQSWQVQKALSDNKIAQQEKENKRIGELQAQQAKNATGPSTSLQPQKEGYIQQTMTRGSVEGNAKYGVGEQALLGILKKSLGYTLDNYNKPVEEKPQFQAPSSTDFSTALSAFDEGITSWAANTGQLKEKGKQIAQDKSNALDEGIVETVTPENIDQYNGGKNLAGMHNLMSSLFGSILDGDWISTGEETASEASEKASSIWQKMWDGVKKALTRPSEPTTPTQPSSPTKTASTVSQGGNAVAGIAQQVVQTVSTQEQGLDETKQKLESINSTADKGADMKVKASSDGSLTTAENALNKLKGSAASGATIKINSGKGDVIGKTQQNAAKGAEMPLKIKDLATSKINQINANARKPVSKTVNISPNYTGTWRKEIYISKTGPGANAYTGVNNKISFHHVPMAGSLARGTKKGRVGPRNQGGLTLTGEKGYEIAWIPSESRSAILGASGPEMVNLPKEAVVYNHDQSKEIMKKRKSIPAGSMDGGSYNSRSSSSTTTATTTTIRKSTGSTISKTVKDTGDKVAKDTENATKKVARVSVWWENIARRTESTQRKMDNNAKEFEKYIKNINATLTSTGTIGKGNDYIQNIKDYIDLNAEQVGRANAELTQLNTGTGKNSEKKKAQKKLKSKYKKGNVNIAEISYENDKGKSKKKFVNLAPYIKKDKATGALQVDENALKTISNVNKRKAVAEAANKEIDDRTSKKTKAEDAIQKAQEALEKMGQDLYETFFKWETELTKIWNITQKIEAAEARAAEAKEGSSLLEAKLASGRAKADGDFAQRSIDMYKSELNSEVKALEQRAASVKEKQDALNRAINIDDEISQLNSITNKLNSATAARTKADKAKQTLDSKQAQLNAKQKELKNARNGKVVVKKTKKDKNGFAGAIAHTVYDTKLINKLEKEVKRLEGEVKTAKQTYNTAQNAAMKDTDRLGYETYAQQLQQDIKAQQTASKYTTITRMGDGTVEVQVDTKSLMDAKDAGQITEAEAKRIEDYVKNIQDSNKDLQDTYKDITSGMTELYNRLDTLQKDWTDYADQLWDISDKEEQERVNELKDLSNSISNALKKLLDDVKKKLDERRQQEDNAKTEAEISQKQQRLTMLRADTSGGHAVEIAQLEQELADARQNYERSLEDQLLEKLQNQADVAQEQRERMIELEEGIKDAVNNAALVNKWMAAAQQASLTGKPELLEEYREQMYNAYMAANEADKKPEVLRQQLEDSFNTLYNGLLTNQAEQEAVKTQLNVLEGTEADIKDAKSLLGQIFNQLEKMSGEVSSQKDPNAGKGAEEAIKNSENAVNASKTTATATATKKTNAEIYKEKLAKYTSNGKLSTNELSYILSYGKQAGKSEQEVVKALANTKVTWKDIITEAKKNKYAESKVRGWFSSSWSKSHKKSFAKAFNSIYKPKKKMKEKYATGGLNTYTGPAWLDGTPSKPELVLNAQDTKNFIALKDVLSKAIGSTSHIENSYGGDANFEININVDHISNDYDVNKVVDQVEKRIVQKSGYRNVTQVRNFR